MSDCEGILFKKGAVRWNMRYFVLRDDVLRYWGTQDQAREQSYLHFPKGGLRVCGVEAVEFSRSQDKFHFDVIGDGVRIHVYAQSDADRERWVSKLNSAVNQTAARRPSSTPQPPTPTTGPSTPTNAPSTPTNGPSTPTSTASTSANPPAPQGPQVISLSLSTAGDLGISFGSNEQAVVASVMGEAAQKGICVGDSIVGINGMEFRQGAVMSARDFTAMAASLGRPLDVKIKRDAVFARPGQASTQMAKRANEGAASLVRQLERQMSGSSVRRAVTGPSEADYASTTDTATEASRAPVVEKHRASLRASSWHVGLVRGDFSAPVPQAKTEVVVFVSSTFSDTQVERLTIAQAAPHLRELCASYGVEFRLIDLRWDVLDIQTHPDVLAFSLSGVRDAQAKSVALSFITLLSTKYGFRSFPHAIPLDEFQKILGTMRNKEDKQFVSSCFELNSNREPRVYELKSREQLLGLTHNHRELRNHIDWWSLFRLLQSLLRTGAIGAELSEDRTFLYVGSLQDHEIRRGIVNAGNPWESAFWLRRTFDGSQSMFKEGIGESEGLIDQVEISAPDRIAASALTDLKETIMPKHLGQQYISYPEPWDGRKRTIQYQIPFSPYGVTHAIPQHAQYLARLCEDMDKVLTQSLSTARIHTSRMYSPCEEETLHHHHLCAQLSTNFTPLPAPSSRSVALQNIANYLSASPTTNPQNIPFVIVGDAGSGKASLVAHAATKLSSHHFCRAVRFVGTTPMSMTMEGLVSSIGWQVCSAFSDSDNVPTIDPNDKKSLATGLFDCLSLSTPSRGIALFLCNVDRLQTSTHAGTPTPTTQQQLNLHLLPTELPPNSRVVLTVSTDTMPDPSHRGEAVIASLAAMGLTSVPSHVLRLEAISRADVTAILDSMLARPEKCEVSGEFVRQLGKDQRVAFENACGESCLPLYVSLAYGAFKNLKSWETAPSIPPTVPSLVQFRIQSLEQQFGSMLVSRVLCLLCAARFGLTNAELEDLLSLDDEVLNEVYKFSSPPVRRISPAILRRLLIALDDLVVLVPLRGRHLLRLSHASVSNAVANMFLDGPYQQPAANQSASSVVANKWKQLHVSLADYFAGVWSKKPKPYSRVGYGGQTVNCSEVRSIMEQSDFFVDIGGKAPNSRRADELPFHFLRSGNSNGLVNLLSLEFVAAKVMSGGLSDLQSLLTDAVVMSRLTRSSSGEFFEKWLRFINRHADALARHPSAVLQQAVNEPDDNQFHTEAASLLETEVLPHLHWVNKPSSLHPCQMTLTGHSAWVSSCCAGGDLIVSGSLDSSVRVWDLHSGLCMHTLDAHTEEVTCCAVTADGKTAISGSSDKTVVVWNLTLPNQVATFAQHATQVRCCALSDDGKLAASGDVAEGETYGSVHVWSVSDTSIVWTLQLEGKHASSLAFSHGAQNKPVMLAVGTTDGQLLLFDTKSATSPKPIRIFEAASRIRGCEFSPDDTIIAAGLGNGRICTFATVGKALLTMEHSAKRGLEHVSAVSFSKSGNLLVSGGRDKIVRIWDVKTGKLLHAFEGHKSWIEGCTFCSDESTVVSASRDFSLKLWDLRTSAPISESTQEPTNGHAKMVTRCAVGSSGAIGATASADRTVLLWDMNTGAQIGSLKDHASWVEDVKLSNNESLIVSCSDDHTVKLWDKSGNLLNVLGDHTSEVVSCCFSNNDKQLVTLDKTSNLMLWNVKTGTRTAQKNIGTPGSVCVFLPGPQTQDQGGFVLVGHDDGSITVWDMASSANNSLFHTQAHDAQVTNIALSAAGQFVVSSSVDRRVRVWKLVENGAERSLKSFTTLVHDNAVTDCCFTPDGFVVTVAGGFRTSDDEGTTDAGDTTLRVWDLIPARHGVAAKGEEADGSVVMVFCAPSTLNCVACGPDSILAGCKKGRVFILKPRLAGGVAHLKEKTNTGPRSRVGFQP